MSRIDFRLWLKHQGYVDKVSSDICCRIRRIESVLINNSISCSLEEEYQKNLCIDLLNTFYIKKSSPYKDIFMNEGFPIFKHSACVYRSAIKLYIRYLS